MLESQVPISGRYRLQHCLHHGSMSDVYLAYDELLQHEVAIKLVSNDQPESKQRLQSEIQILRKLSHDHILTILDHGEYEEFHYLIMPYIKQGTLRNRIVRERLTKEETGNILMQITSALQFAHDQGIVHRDIKPSNILLDGVPNQHVYLADFGLAKEMDKGSDLTQTGCLIGTPAYMAPELIDMPESVSSDIYALGVLLYHMLTGYVPFSGGSPLAVYWKHIYELPVPPSRLNPAITTSVEQVIMRALNKDPHRRFPSAQALAQAYMNALQASNKYAVAHLAIQAFEPTLALRAFKKREHLILPAVVKQRSPLPWWQNLHHDFQKAFIGLALVALFIIPLPLGFLLGRAIALLPPAYKTSVAGVLQQSSLSSTPPTIPAVHPTGGNTIPPHATLSFPLHEHNNPQDGHGNGNGNGNGHRHGNGNGNGNGNSNGHGHGNGNGNSNGHGHGNSNGNGNSNGHGHGNGNGNGNGHGHGQTYL